MIKEFIYELSINATNVTINHCVRKTLNFFTYVHSSEIRKHETTEIKQLMCIEMVLFYYGTHSTVSVDMWKNKESTLPNGTFLLCNNMESVDCVFYCAFASGP